MIDHFDALMFAVAAYVAVATLVRLMASRRDEVVGYLHAEFKRRAAEAADDEDEAEESRDVA